MPIKLLHTADIHLGAKFLFLGNRASEQREQIKKTFENTVNSAIEKGVNLFVISGDLFDSSFPSLQTVLFVKDQLFKLADNNIKVAVIPGNHDRVEIGSVWSQDLSEGDPNIYIFNNINKKEWVLNDLGLTIYGVVNTLKKSKESPLKEVKKNSKTKFHIALIHGSVTYVKGIKDANFPISEQDVSASGMNYIALGDWHGYLDVSKGATKAWYSGAPEMIGPDQLNSRNVLLVEIDDQGVRVSPTKIGMRSIEVVEVDLSTIQTIEELVNKLVIGADKDLVRIIKLKGVKKLELNLDLDELKAVLADKFFYVDIKDESSVVLNDSELAKYSNQFLVGRFIELMQQKKISAVNKEIFDEAVQLGVSLLNKPIQR